MTETNGRKADHAIDPLFLERWSPRAFTGEGISEADLAILLEAGRWAPSSYNSQPWRFLYARRDTPQFETFLDLLIPFNRSWASQASALIILVSRKTLPAAAGDAEVPSHSHSFDAGAAWSNIALQATLSGWHAHAMVGFDIARAALVLKVPDAYRVEAAIAIGRRGDASVLPEALAVREIPSPRKPLAELAFEGEFLAEPQSGSTP